jgi:hypothetical protein
MWMIDSFGVIKDAIQLLLIFSNDESYAILTQQIRQNLNSQ